MYLNISLGQITILHLNILECLNMFEGSQQVYCKRLPYEFSHGEQSEVNNGFITFLNQNQL